MLDLDPEVAMLVSPARRSPLSAQTLAARRADERGAATSLSDAIERRDHPVSDAVLVRVHRPIGVKGALPCVYSIHGGWYVLGNRAMDDARFDRWCRAHRCVGVSVEYCWAPETPYPGPLEDCYHGLTWIFDHHDEIGVDLARIGVAGTSAGAGLAAALTLLARDRGEMPLQFQLLDAPMIDDRQMTPSSRMDDLIIYDRHSAAFGWRSYLGELYGRPDVPAYAAPARATDLEGLPPAYICVGNVDGFRDEAIDYATRLNQHGVACELHVHPGAPHGVTRFDGTAVARRYEQEIDDWIGRQLRGL